MGYTINNFNIFGGRNHRLVKNKGKKNDDEQNNTTRTATRALRE